MIYVHSTRRLLAQYMYEQFPNGGWVSLYGDETIYETRGRWWFKKSIALGTKRVERTPRQHVHLEMDANGFGLHATTDPDDFYPTGPVGWVGLHAAADGALMDLVPFHASNAFVVTVRSVGWEIR